MDRGKVLWEKDLEEIKGNWGRYLDKDGDGIPYRTFPGNKHPLSAYFTRGTGHDEYAKYTEDAGTYMRNMERLKTKYYNAANYIPKPINHPVKGATVGIIAYGSTENAVLEAQYHLTKDDGINADFLRVRALPFTEEVTKFIEKYDQIFIVEMNRDGQMHQILLTEYPQFAGKFKSVAYHDGLPAAAKWVREGILAKYEAESKTQKVVAQKKASAKKTAVNAKAASKSKKEATKKPAKQPVKKTVAKSKSTAKAKRK
jgi:2-oxoglutarate ferredoxin oxidoreductase subunit alpha